MFYPSSQLKRVFSLLKVGTSSLILSVMNNNPTPSTSSPTNHNSALWKEIWNNNCIPRLSTWTWQALHQCLPAATELRKRSLIQSDLASFSRKLQNQSCIFFMSVVLLEISDLLSKRIISLHTAMTI